MTRKEQNKILDDKIECNVNQYKVDRLNAEISAFSSGDLNKYEFLTRKDLKYKPNALDKARFEFSPLGKAFSIGLNKTAVGYQEEGVIKLLKDIRDGLAGNVNRSNNRPDDNNDDDRPGRPDDESDDGPDDEDGDNNADMPDLETEEEAKDFYEQKKESKTSDNNKIEKLKDRILCLDNELLIKEKDKLYEELQNNKAKIYNMLNKVKDEIEKYYNKLSKADDILDESNNRLNKLNDKVIKIKKVLDDKALSDDEINKLQIEIKDLDRKLKEEKKIKELFRIKIF